MYYFLNDNMQYSKSGIEHAEINRLDLFKASCSAKIVTRFSMKLENVLQQSGIVKKTLLICLNSF